MLKVLSLAVVVSALASGPPHLATRDEVLALAKRDSFKFCTGNHLSCEFSVSANPEEGWDVFVLQVSTQPDGRKGYPVGGHRIYVYYMDGELVRVMPGL